MGKRRRRREMPWHPAPPIQGGCGVSALFRPTHRQTPTLPCRETNTFLAACRAVAVSLLGLWGVDWGSLVGDISDESVVVISGVGGGLDSAVGKSNHEATSDDAIAIL